MTNGIVEYVKKKHTPNQRMKEAESGDWTGIRDCAGG